MSTALQKAFCPILSLGISHYCKEIEQNRWPGEGALRNRKNDNYCSQSKWRKISTSYSIFSGSKRLCSFLYPCTRKKKSQMGENKGDFIKLWKFKTPCQGMQKRHRSSCNTLVAPSLPQKDLPSHVNSFLVEVQWSTWRPAASTFFSSRNRWKPLSL